MTQRSERNVRNRMLRGFAILYLILIIPLVLTYLGLSIWSGLSGRALLISCLPAATVLCILLLLFLVRPRRFARIWSGEPVEEI